jgi:hypothetical protein
MEHEPEPEPVEDAIAGRQVVKVETDRAGRAHQADKYK